MPPHRRRGPLPLLTYADARKHARDMLDVVTDGRMPPWLPAAGTTHLVGERRLSGTEVLALRGWLDAGMPEGNRDSAPSPPSFHDGWQLGAPDVLIEFPRPIHWGPTGRTSIVTSSSPSPAAPIAVRAGLEFRPNSPAVHHARLLMPPGRADDSTPLTRSSAFRAPCRRRSTRQATSSDGLPDVAPCRCPQG